MICLAAIAITAVIWFYLVANHHRNRAANLVALNLELRYQLDDAQRDNERLRTSNDRHVQETTTLCIDLHHTDMQLSYYRSAYMQRKSEMLMSLFVKQQPHMMVRDERRVP